MTPEVIEIRLEDCFVCESTGYMLGLALPDGVFYAGPGEAGRQAAWAAAEAQAESRRKQWPNLTFIVENLNDYLQSWKRA